MTFFNWNANIFMSSEFLMFSFFLCRNSQIVVSKYIKEILKTGSVKCGYLEGIMG